MSKKEKESPAVKIEEYFDSLSKKVFNTPELLREFNDNRVGWELAASTNFDGLVDFLIRESKLEKVELVHTPTSTEKNYANIHRYCWGIPSIYNLALSIKGRSFLAYGTAAFLHGLSDITPQKIFVNYEQSPKSQNGILSQEGIDRAFSKGQRQTNLVYMFDNKSIVVINGKNTGNIGICSQNSLALTDIERTLIDITVRPAYAGSPSDILEIYRRAKDKVDIKTLLKMLKTMNYIYPYHQAIGFFMETAGYPKKAWSKFLEFGINYNFYVTHQLLESKKFNSKWQVFYPKELE